MAVRVFSALIAFAVALPAQAADDRIDTLERRLDEQRGQIARLEALVAQQAELLRKLGSPSATVEPVRPVRPAQASAVAPVVAAAPGAARPGSRLDLSGDLRVRQEWNFGAGRDRSRSVLRARLRASYAMSERVSVGAQLVTGDPDDPNTADVTLGNFLDDLPVSLDQAWIRYRRGAVTAWAGKMPLPFRRTDMVWDGDVSPQGVAIAASLPVAGATLDARGLWFVIDESAVARDSEMLGGQAAVIAPLGSDFSLDLAGSYYQYRLGSLAGADAGDFRGNLISGGRYLSDFRLAEGIGTLRYTGIGPRWPVSLAADYVRNLGAAVDGDTGFTAELAAGRATQSGDLRLAYSYSRVEVDAVLAAFSHDNLDLSTNYLLHSLTLGFVPADGLLIEGNFYHYRPLDPAFAAGPGALIWRDRVRLNLMVQF